MAGFYVVYHFAVLAMTGELVMELLSARIDMDGFDAIGMDILGWDNCSFHSFLCNSLQDEFPDIRFNKYGFIETYHICACE